VTAIVGVHGIGNYRKGRRDDVASYYSSRWTASLRQGLAGADLPPVSIAYYGDLLRGPVAQGDVEVRALPPDAKSLIYAWVADLGYDVPATAQGYPTVPIRLLLDWVAKRYNLDRGATEIFVTKLFGEVAVYFRDPARREKARNEVIATVEREKAQIVVAHSLGSVVAYEALHSQPDLGVELFITLGSPLGMPGVIFEKLQPGPIDGRGIRPPGITRWVNIADRGDPVAIPVGGLTPLFGVDSDYATLIGLFEFHRVLKYLAEPTTATAIVGYIGT
jgi:hypothetical protein